MDVRLAQWDPPYDDSLPHLRESKNSCLPTDLKVKPLLRNSTLR